MPISPRDFEYAGFKSRRFDAHVLCPFEDCLNETFFTPVWDHLNAGDAIDIVRFVNGDKKLVVGILPNVRVVSATKWSVALLPMAEPKFTDHKPETGFVIVPGPPWQVRHEGRYVGTFNTRVEADELIASKGFAIRKDGPRRFVVHRLGNDLQAFADKGAALAYLTDLAKAA